MDDFTPDEHIDGPTPAFLGPDTTEAISIPDLIAAQHAADAANPAPEPAAPAELPFAIDTRPLTVYKDDVLAWSTALQHAIQATTGQLVSQDGLAYFLADFRHAVQVAESRSIAFGIANSTIREDIAGDPADVALRFRDLIAAQTRQRYQNIPTGV